MDVDAKFDGEDISFLLRYYLHRFDDLTRFMDEFFPEPRSRWLSTAACNKSVAH